MEDRVMSSEAILEYPALFEGEKIVDMDVLIQEYLDLVEKYPQEMDGERKQRRPWRQDNHRVKTHLFKFMYAGFDK